MPPHSPKTYRGVRPAFLMPAELESPSEMLDRKMAVTATQLTAPPLSRLSPMTTDSGTPSSSDPTAMARPLPLSSASDGCRLPDRLRCLAPCRARNQLAAVKADAPT